MEEIVFSTYLSLTVGFQRAWKFTSMHGVRME